jgi:Relaxase/Mobilisation nuclease domain
VIAKITRGSNFKGAAGYILDERRGLDHDHQPEIIAGNMAGRTSGQLTREFEAVRRQRPDIGKPVEHVALSFARDDRRLSNDDMARLADDYVRRRGYDPGRCQYVVVRHHDKEHQHCHILVNRVRTDRTVVPQQFREYVRNKETCRALERDHDLRPVRSERQQVPIHERTPTRGEDRMRRDRGAESEKEQLKALVREAAAGKPTMREFVRRLEARGVQVRANIARTGHVSGISYRLDHVAVKGSGLGRTYSFEGVQSELSVRYEPRRDLPELQRAARATRGREPAWRRDKGLASRLAGRLGRRVKSRIPGVREVRTLASLARDLKQLTKSPSRAALNLAARALPPQARVGLLIARTLMDLSRTR